LQDLSNIFSAPFSGYNVPLGFFNDSNSSLWQVAIGYEISGLVGILLVGGIVYGLTLLIARTRQRPGGDATPTPEVSVR
jgi:hypothetical protein